MRRHFIAADISVAEAMVIGLAVYLAQVVFSMWWLGRYRYVPVEWLWRTRMYGAPQPMSLTRLSRSKKRTA